LSNFAETLEERIRLMREASANDPTNDALLELLADALFRNDAREAAEILERAYAVAPTSRRRQHLVSKAIIVYKYAGALEQANALQNRAREDFAIDARLAELANPAATSPDRVGTALEDVCAADMMVIFGWSACVEGIVRAGEAAKGVNALDEGVARGVLTAAQSAAQLAESHPEWRARFLSVLEPIVASGTASSATYRALALITTDKEQRLRTMQKAATRFPSDGEIVLGLGLAFYDVRKMDDAISAFSKAKGLLPDMRQPFIDQMLGQARALLD
jgi:tetratricopeptide (TPR) repeat protein